MKMKFLAAFLGAAAAVIVAAGCVSTVEGTTKAGVPFVKDRIISRYERPVDEVFQAAQDVVKFNGVIVRTSVVYGRTNMVDNILHVVEGKIRQRTVWVSVGQLNPKITEVAVQVRTSGGGSDIDLTAEVDKQIALKLVSR